MPSKKKSNKKGTKPTSGFDYEALIPSCLSGDDRVLVRKFLLNELESAEERDAALAVFAAAVIEDRDESGVERDSSDARVMADLRNAAAGHFSSSHNMESSHSAAIVAAEFERQTVEAHKKFERAAGGASSSSSSSYTAPSVPPVPTLADHIAALKITKAKKAKAKAPVQTRRGSVSGESWNEDTGFQLLAAPPPTNPPPLTDSQSKRVNPEVANEIRKNVNVGWWASDKDANEETDVRIADYAQSLGGELYNFISYPIGGMKRSKHNLTSDLPIPPINLPDLQLANPHWETYVVGHPSEWIDCDDMEEDPWASMLSAVELEKELNYAHYLGLNMVVVSLWHKTAPALAQVISKFLWTVQSNLKITVMLPTEVSLMQGNEADERELWEIWADFRKLCGNFAGDRLFVGFKLMEDLDYEFVEPLSLQRWQAEPVSMFTVETNVFTTNERTGGADLGPAHTRLLETLWTSETMTAAVRGPVDAGARLQFCQAIRSIIGPLWLKKKLSKKQNFLDASEICYHDVIQKPLQPLADNLQSTVYNTFEADAPKYKYYGEAVEAAIHDMVKRRGKGDIVLYVLGAGRGPLMSASIAAEKRVNEVLSSGGPRVKMELVCVEKNENAVVTLNYLNSNVWRGRVRIVQADMRHLKAAATGLGLRRPDIIVSELLGSFGDNELSPECLDGCVDWLKEDTISVPQSYTSYCEPIASLSLYHTIRAQATNYYLKGRQGNGRCLTVQEADGTFTQAFPQTRDVASMDMLYVVYLDKVVRQMAPKPYFTFTHPCFDRLQTTRERWKIVQQWEAPTTQDIMGFACYFSARLYKDVTLSIVRGNETPDMLSWFPAVLPLREPLRVHKGDQVCFSVERCVDNGGVWYEWFALVSGPDVKVPPRRTETQNVNGVSYYMRLISEQEKELLGETLSPEKFAQLTSLLTDA